MRRRLGVIITAGGSSTRFGGDKLTAMLGGRSVIRRSVESFLRVDDCAVIVVALPVSLSADALLAREVAAIAAASADRVRFAMVGGASRAETVRNALGHVDAACEWIAVHDGARPLVSAEMIARVFAAAIEHGAAAPAVAVTSTIKQGGTTLPTRVERTLPRPTLWAMQTPQIARRADLLDGYARCPLPLGQITDDVQLLELIGRPVMLVAGDERNLKITTPLDLTLAALLDVE